MTRYFQLSPPDLTTAADVAAISVWADQSGPMEVEKLQSVAALISLTTWPEGTPVPWAPKYLVAASSKDRDPFSRIMVQPEVSLSPRWYALKVAELPGGTAVRMMTSHRDGVPLGGTMVRFRPDSTPRIVAIDESFRREDPSFPFPKGFPYLLQVRLSEVLRIEDTAGIALGGAGQSECLRAELAGEITARVPFDCRSSVLADLTVSVVPLTPSGPKAGLTEALIHVAASAIVAPAEKVKRYDVDLR